MMKNILNSVDSNSLMSLNYDVKMNVEMRSQTETEVISNINCYIVKLYTHLNQNVKDGLYFNYI